MSEPTFDEQAWRLRNMTAERDALQRDLDETQQICIRRGDELIERNDELASVRLALSGAHDDLREANETASLCRVALSAAQARALAAIEGRNDYCAQYKRVGRELYAAQVALSGAQADLAQVTQERDDTKADYLRRHKDACDRWLKVKELEADLALRDAEIARLHREAGYAAEICRLNDSEIVQLRKDIARLNAIVNTPPQTSALDAARRWLADDPGELDEHWLASVIERERRAGVNTPPGAGAIEISHQYAEDWFNRLDRFSDRVKAREALAAIVEAAEARGRAEYIETSRQLRKNAVSVARAEGFDEGAAQMRERAAKECIGPAHVVVERIRALPDRKTGQ